MALEGPSEVRREQLAELSFRCDCEAKLLEHLSTEISPQAACEIGRMAASLRLIAREVREVASRVEAGDITATR